MKFAWILFAQPRWRTNRLHNRLGGVIGLISHFIRTQPNLFSDLNIHNRLMPPSTRQHSLQLWYGTSPTIDARSLTLTHTRALVARGLHVAFIFIDIKTSSNPLYPCTKLMRNVLRTTCRQSVHVSLPKHLAVL